MSLYIIGKCPECNKIVAAAIDTCDAEAIREAINEFIDCGHIVSAIRTNDSVTLDGCSPGCRRKSVCVGD